MYQEVDRIRGLHPQSRRKMPIARRKKEKYAVAVPSAMPPLMPMPMPSAVAEKGKHSADWTKIAPLFGSENKEMGGGGREGG